MLGIGLMGQELVLDLHRPAGRCDLLDPGRGIDESDEAEILVRGYPIGDAQPGGCAQRRWHRLS